MREILFKAKRLDNKKWVEGVPVDVTPLHCFSEDNIKKEVVMVRARFADWGMPRGIEGVKVYPSTVCQYIGLKDKNKVKIFEGDIIRIIGSKKPGLPSDVKYLSEQCQFVIHRDNYNPIWMSEFDPEKHFEIIGNIYGD
nr:MAG TPA: YopX protein [Caudoviricetes sp.]